MLKLPDIFKMQRELMDRYDTEHPIQPGEERLTKRFIAFFAELGEFLQEWKGFKYWSKNQQPRTIAVRVPAMMEEDKEYYNPLLEEFIDGFHFILELGLSRGHENITLNVTKRINIHNQIISIIDASCQYFYCPSQSYFQRLIGLYIGLGEMLGFTWEQMVQAYVEKNEINHARQDQGY